MFKILSILLIILSNINAYAFYSTKTKVKNSFVTEKINIKLNANGGKYEESIKFKKNEDGTIDLPHPIKRGYTFKKYKAKNNLQIDEPIKSLSEINNKELIADYDLDVYTINLELDGGTIKNYIDKYTIEDVIIIDIPEKDGYIFEGWQECDNREFIRDLKIEKGTSGNLCYKAKWIEEKYKVRITPNVDGIDYLTGNEEYTFDIWKNDKLIASNVIDWEDSVKRDTKIRAKANDVEGRTTDFDKTYIINKNTEIKPTWTINNYDSEFYCNNNYLYKLNNKYGTKVEYLPINIENYGYNTNFYYLNGFLPRDSWYQKAYTMRFDAIIDEYNCMTSYGSSTINNAYEQLYKLNSYGYYTCSVNPSWNALECYGKANYMLELYNNAWNILPRSGNGYSRYKQMSCDSGYLTYNYR